MFRVNKSKFICPLCREEKLVLWDENKKASCLHCNNTFTAKELFEEYKKIDRHGFIVLTSKSFSSKYSTAYTEIREVKCPICNKEFTQKGEGGCFGCHYMPFLCPKCSHPTSTNDLKYRLRKVIDERNEKQK